MPLGSVIQPSGRLELTWTNKPLRLLADEAGGYEWTQPSDYRVAEVRLLHDVAHAGSTRSQRSRAQDNLLIRGDALHALTSLTSLPEFQREYGGKVKLAYIDPPFNTQQAFAQYDDALEHSVWLTMMRDRLIQIRDLLAPDGSVWVHLDDAEQAYCRVLMDEVFGRSNFIATVVWKKADSPRNSARYFSTDQDYIHVYARNAATWRPNRLPRTDDTNAAYTNPDDDPRGPWIPGDPFANKPYALGRYQVTGPTGNAFGPPPGRYWRISEEKFLELDRTGQIYWRGGGEARPRIKRYLSEVGDLVPRTFWDFMDVGSNGTSSREIRKLFPDIAVFATPKPEGLIERILQIGSKPGDIVLDSFAGSGTTAAVAQKMHRRWVTVERSRDTVEKYTLPRLSKVVAGDDPGGITMGADWRGGGGFRVVDVAASMFERLGDRIVLARWTSGGALAECVAAQTGFVFDDGEPPFAGRKGRQRLAVIDGLVNEDVLALLVDWLESDELLIVYGTALDPTCRSALSRLRRGSVAKRIPQAVLDDYRGRAQRTGSIEWPSLPPTAREPEPVA